MLISESEPGLMPRGRSFRRLAACVKTVNISETDSLWPWTLKCMAFFTDFTKTSTAPWYHGLSAGPKCHLTPISAPLCVTTSRSTDCQRFLSSSLAPTNWDPGSEKTQMANLWAQQTSTKPTRMIECHNRTSPQCEQPYSKGLWRLLPRPSRLCAFVPHHG